MKISLQQINTRISDIEGNLSKICGAINGDRESNLFVFPELALHGYMPYDLYFNMDRSTILDSVDCIADCLGQDQYAVVGLVLPYFEHTHLDSSLSRDFSDFSSEITGAPILKNCACVIGERGVIHVQVKESLPDYNVFFESRYFCGKVVQQGREEKSKQCLDLLIDAKTYKIAFLICEDIWHSDEENSPVKKLASENPDLLVCVSASPFEHDKLHKRMHVSRRSVSVLNCPLLYVNMVGANDEVVFDGNSFVFDSQGKIKRMLSFCEEDCAILEYKGKNEIYFLSDSTEKQESIEDNKTTIEFASRAMPHIRDAQNDILMERVSKVLELGLSDYLQKSELSQRVHLGLSGGIDSAITATIAVRALGREQVVGILLPSQFTSDESNSDALELARRLGIETYSLSIEDLYSSAEKVLSPVFNCLATEKELASTLAEENIQARLRGLLLMAYSNKLGSTLLTTGNKSEIAVGYCTLYGDMNGSLNLIGDLYKTEVYALAKYLNKREEIIPQNIIEKEPSAELRENQKDSDSLPPYDVLDTILRLYIEQHRRPEQLIEQNIADEETVRKVWSLYRRSEYKRYQAAPIIKLSSHAFGKGRIVPLVSKS